MKIVLANSVGIGPNGERYVHFPSRWSAVESPSWYDHKKGWMTFYPFMLAYLSSLLKRDTDCYVKFLDGNLNNWNHKEYLKRILKEKPDWLVMESSTLSIPMDMSLAIDVKRLTGCRLLFAGQHPTAFPEEVLSAGADHVCIGEYEHIALELFKGKDPSQIAGLYPNPRGKAINPDDLPWPEDDDVRRIDYIEPVVNEYRELEMFASRGCPLACSFCVASNIYYGGAGTWRPRNVNDVTDEISAMKRKYPEMEGVFFDDEVHNGRKDFVIELCRSIVDKGLDGLKYNAMCGYWNMDEEMLSWMKKAGYYKLRVGIETADKSVAVGIGKSHSIKRLYSALEAAKKCGIKIYGTFTYGAPGSTAGKDRKTTELISDLLKKGLLFDCQISICTPQPGTPFFKQVMGEGAMTTREWNRFDGGRNVIQSYPDYSADEILETVSHARRTASLYGGPARYGAVDFSAVSSLPLDGRNVLAIGSGPKWQTDKIIDELKKGGAGKITLLVRSALESEFPGFDLETFSDGPLNIESFPDDKAERIKKTSPRLVLVQINHNSEDVSDYREVARLAEKLGESVVGVNVSGSLVDFKKLAGSSAQ